MQHSSRPVVSRSSASPSACRTALTDLRWRVYRLQPSPETHPPRSVRMMSSHSKAKFGGTQRREIIGAARVIHIAAIATHGRRARRWKIAVDGILGDEQLLERLE